MALAMDRPNPVPPLRLESEASAWENFSKALAWKDSGRPGALSET